MHKYQPFVNGFLLTKTKNIRKGRKTTQEIMSEKLRISTRNYGDLERGKHGYSATTLLFLLWYMDETERQQFWDDFGELVRRVEEQEDLT